jgi:hypothetical protein
MKTMAAALLAVMCLGGLVWSQDPPRPTLELLHAPQGRVVIDGQAQLSSGQATITLPAWFESSVHTDGRTVQLTCQDAWSQLWASGVASGQFTVSTNGSSSTQIFYWQVSGRLK